MDQVLEIFAAFVAFASMVLSIFTLIVTRRKASGEIRVRFIERLIDKRMQSYPELWRITSRVYREDDTVDETSFDSRWAKNLHKEIMTWYNGEGNGIYLNTDTKNAFFEFEFALKNFDPSTGREEIRENGNLLRKELRADLKLETRASENIEI
jgi:hypothetical protein